MKYRELVTCGAHGRREALRPDTTKSIAIGAEKYARAVVGESWFIGPGSVSGDRNPFREWNRRQSEGSDENPARIVIEDSKRYPTRVGGEMRLEYVMARVLNQGGYFSVAGIRCGNGEVPRGAFRVLGEKQCIALAGPVGGRRRC